MSLCVTSRTIRIDLTAVITCGITLVKVVLIKAGVLNR